MRLHITIDGPSAEDLFPVGPNDLLNYFLPEKLGVDPKDVKPIRFTDVEKNIVHTDNYRRK